MCSAHIDSIYILREEENRGNSYVSYREQGNSYAAAGGKGLLTPSFVTPALSSLPDLRESQSLLMTCSEW